MATISVSRPHSLSPSEAREKAESIARRFQDRLEVSWHWDGDALHLTADRGRARGTSGQVLIGERVIDITIHLPFHLRPLRAFLHTELVRRLETLLGPVPSY